MAEYRIQVVGTSCSGKSTLAEKLSCAMNIPHVELDELFWKQGWIESDSEEFYHSVAQAIDQDSYVCCGNYSRVRELLFLKATHIVWLNYSFQRVLFRALKRTIHRSLFKVKVCNGNVESFKKSFLSKDSILLWVIKTYKRRRKEYPVLLKKEALKGTKIIELKRPCSTQKLIEKIFKE